MERRKLRKSVGHIYGQNLAPFKTVPRPHSRFNGFVRKLLGLVLALSMTAGTVRCPEVEIVKQAGTALMAAARAASPSQFARALRDPRRHGYRNHVRTWQAPQQTSLLKEAPARVAHKLRSFRAPSMTTRLKFKAKSMEVEDCRRGTVRNHVQVSRRAR